MDINGVMYGVVTWMMWVGVGHGYACDVLPSYWVEHAAVGFIFHDKVASNNDHHLQ